MKQRRGFSLVEVTIAILLLSAIGAGIARVLAESVRTSRTERYRATATRLAASTIERLKAAGPAAYTTAADTFRVRGDGVRDENGIYQIEISTELTCDAGLNPESAVTGPLNFPGDCDEMRPRIGYRVLVRFPDHQTGTAFADSVSYTLFIGPSGRHANVFVSP